MFLELSRYSPLSHENNKKNYTQPFLIGNALWIFFWVIKLSYELNIFKDYICKCSEIYPMTNPKSFVKGLLLIFHATLENFHFANFYQAIKSNEWLIENLFNNVKT